MSATVVLDASALLALLHEEPGSDVVEEVLGDAVISSVNWAEVSGLPQARGLPAVPFRETVAALSIAIRPFGPDDADATGALLAATRGAGLSLADRACLALAQTLDAPAMTADRTWLPLDVGVEIQLVR